jgi:hypothetical protein
VDYNFIFVSKTQKMDLFWQLLISLAPAAVVFLTVSQFLKRQSEKDAINLNGELKKERQAFFLPNRLEAYQRVILYLERIHPNAIIMRLHNPNLGAKAFQGELIKTIREEFDHNVAQQLFISGSAWELLSNAKEETTKIINVAAQNLPDDATATNLAEKVFELVGEVGEVPSEIAVKSLKAEFQKLF